MAAHNHPVLEHLVLNLPHHNDRKLHDKGNLLFVSMKYINIRKLFYYGCHQIRS